MDYIQVSAKTVEDAVLEAAMKLATTRENALILLGLRNSTNQATISRFQFHKRSGQHLRWRRVITLSEIYHQFCTLPI